MNMLRPARVAPNVSADAYMTETEIHLKPTARETWEEHSAPGCNTVFFKHKYQAMPTIKTGDTLLKTAIDLKDTIEKKRIQDSKQKLQ